MLTPSEQSTLRALCTDGDAYLRAMALMEQVLARQEQTTAVAAPPSVADRVMPGDPQHLLRTVIDHYPFGAIIVFDHELRYQVVGGSAELEALGLDPVAMRGRTVFEIFGDEFGGVLAPAYRQALQGESVRLEVPYQDQVYETRLEPLYDDGGAIAGGILISANVTRARQAEDKAAANLQRTQALIQAIPDPIFVVDQEGRFAEAHLPEGADVPWTRSHLVGAHLREVLPPGAAAQLQECVDTVRSQGGTASASFELTDAQGRVFYLEARCARTNQDQVLITVHDTTALTQALLDLSERESFLDSIFQGIDSYLFVVDVEDGAPPQGPTFRFAGLNSAYERELGLSAEWIRGRTLDELSPILPAEAIEAVRHRYQECLDAGVSIQYEEMVPINGHDEWALTRLIPLKRPDGTTYRLVGTAMSITDRVHTEHNLRAERTRLQTLVDSLDEPIWMLDHQRTLRVANDPALAILTQSYGQPVQRGSQLPPFPLACDSCEPDAPCPRIPCWNRHYANALAGETGRLDATYAVAGSDRDYTFLLKPICDTEDHVIGLTVLGHDVTEMEQLMAMKDEFVSTVSHELRTPLTSIRGALGLLSGGAVPVGSDAAKPLLDIAYTNSERLVILINDILDMEKVESGRLGLDPEIQPLAPIAEQALRENQPFADEYGVRLRLESALAASESLVLVDEARVAQILNNLLSNAIKYSAPGDEVQVRLEATGTHVQLQVSDTGAGIPLEFQPHVFEKFTQARNSQGGTGLGLTISKSLTELMQGILSFSSVPGVGTTFTVAFPSQTAPLDQAPERAVDDQRRILICEDDARVASTLQDWLAGNGYVADTVVSAEQALRKLEQRPYDGMVLDLMLPGEDGRSLLAKLRAHPRLHRLPVIIASVLGANEHDIASLNISSWLRKPFNADEFKASLEGLAARGPVAGSKPTVLHVEDDPDIRMLVSTLLAPTLNVLSAPSLARARDMLQTQSVDLVLLDLHLPDGNGAELLPMLHASAGPAVPIVVFSSADPDYPVPAPVSAFLTKALVSNEELARTIHAHLPVDGAELALAT